MAWLVKHLGEFFGRIAAWLFRSWAEERRKNKGVVRQIGNDDDLKDAINDSIRDSLADPRMQPESKD